MKFNISEKCWIPDNCYNQYHHPSYKKKSNSEIIYHHTKKLHPETHHKQKKNPVHKRAIPTQYTRIH
jgi:hypothetical protein